MAPANATASTLRWFEGLRAAAEFGALAAATPALHAVPRGDGHSVIVLPGLGADDISTVLLRGYLNRIGYRSHGWNLGRNLGLQRAGTLSAVIAQLETVSRERNAKVSLVGWSLGGVFARLATNAAPHLIRQVITLGSPLGAARWNSRVTPPESRQEVPTTAIFSRSDSIVPWQIAMTPPGPRAENIEVFGSHVGLGTNTAVWFAVADRLAQADGKFAPFARTGWHSWMYGSPGAPARV